MGKIKKQCADLIDGKEMFILAVAVVCLLVLVVFGFGKALVAIENAKENMDQAATMKTFVTEYGNKAARLNQEAYRPITADQMDNVQSNLLLALQANQMDLLGFKNIKQNDKNPTGQIFELDFTGSWASTVHVLRNFHARDALISIESTKISPDKDAKVKTILQYKIYVK